MSTENTETPVDPITDDLDAFSAELFGQSKPVTEETTSEDTKVTEEESDATKTDDTQTDEDDTLDSDDGTEETEETSEEETPEPKKESRAEKRIKELNTKLREAERREQEFTTRLEELEKQQKQPENKKTETANTGPAPDDTKEDGTEKYPLGEFDPNYIRDLTKFTLQQETQAMKAREAEESQQEKYETERKALATNWQEKLVPAQERYPDFHDKGEELFDTFNGIDQKYGEYLTATLMSMDYGPDVLYYLANNLDEANKIVASGPTRATIALGRLEAKFAEAEAEKTLARPKISKAPAPPASLKGVESVQEVPDDTDDLDAFSKKLFKKK